MTKDLPAGAVRRYTPTAQVLHWAGAALVFLIVPFGWVAVALPKESSWNPFFFTLHKSLGLTILAMTAVRLTWRVRHLAPALPPGMVCWEEVAAKGSHWLLYVVLIGMPVSGYLLSAAAGHTGTYFGLFGIPGLPKSKALMDVAMFMHVLTGQWAVYVLVLLHLAATVFHVCARRDGIIDRMLPQQTRRDGL